VSAIARIPMAQWVRGAAILIGAAILGWIAQASTISTVLGSRRLETPLSWWPAGSAGLAAAAANQLSVVPQSPASLGDAQTLAIRALERDPTNVIAARTLGLVYARRGDHAASDRLLHYAEALSRRDLATQLWFIEDRVQRNDINGALTHYDRALRTSPRARDVLLPILVQAAADPAISPPLTRLIAQRPPWWSYFLDRLIADGDSPAALTRTVLALRLDPADPAERDDLGRALRRMVDIGAFDAARALDARLGRRRPAAGEFIRNGGFEENDGFGPFDWRLTNQPDLAGVRRGQAGRVALLLISSNGRSGNVAGQLTMMPPGRYQIGMRAGAIAGEAIARPNVRIVCANDAREVLLDGRLAPAPAGGQAVAFGFEVPAARCPAQWVYLQAGAGLDTQPETPWLDDISIRAR